LNPVTEFEIKFADKIQSAYAIAVNSGTSALHAVLVACNVKGKEVIMPGLCPAMDAFAIIHAGGIPVFADVDPQTHLVTYETLKWLVNARTGAIICVALHGLPVDISPIMSAFSNRGVHIIEDCAQALLAPYEDGFAGTKADFGCFSFEKKKHLTTGSEGGMIITNNAALAQSARKFAGIGYKHMTAEAGRTSLNASIYKRPDYERFDTIGLNYRLSEAQADIGLEKLKTIDDAIKLRQDIGHLWETVIGKCQPHLYDADNTYYSAAFDYAGDWLNLYNDFTALGGDGFYAMPQCAYNEPALKDKVLKCPAFSVQEMLFPPNCPNAEKLQKQLVLFKTHYKIMAHAKRQVEILRKSYDP
jgi:perosamine synthetase